MRKRVAVLVAQIDETTQKRFLTEFISQAYAYDMDICVFTMYQKYQETKLRDIGDSNIFELVNFKMYDAIVMLSDTILTPGMAQELEEKIKVVFKGPVLIVDKESGYFESVMMDHYTPVRKIVDHLIEVHGYTEIAFLGGKEGHPHSVQRLNAYLDSMKEHGLTVREDWIYHGNYWYDSAERFVDILLEDREHLPQALACANDCMAIGAATRLSENGIKVPEQIAITGYDSIEMGKHSPSPLTSADIPADECGKYCMNWIYSAIEGVPMEHFETNAPLFIGGSCGCKHEIEMVPKALRPQWRTQQSSRSMFSDFNHILEDLLTQSNLKDFLQVIADYSYQIRPFTSFDVFLNEGFSNPASFIGEKAIRKGYAKKIYHVLNCEGTGEKPGTIDFNKSFAVDELYPKMNEDRAYPTTYIFNPLYFDDRCFGYTVLNYGKKVTLYSEGYRIWMRNIMQGMEAFYRQGYMMALVEHIKADQVRDTMTGLYNYEGFVRNVSAMLPYQTEEKQLNILTMDIKGLKPVNEIYGRDYGERAIKAVARMLQGILHEDEICCRMYNDEFLIALFDDENASRAEHIFDVLQKVVASYRLIEDVDYVMQIHYANLLGRPSDVSELESLVNRTISFKNHKKSTLKQVAVDEDVMAEIQRNQLVMHILNQNLLTYYYQPIVNVVDGSVYAYEALMRYEKEKISPFQIIQSATYLNRLQDIERATLLNVTADVDKNIELFGDAKVFMNSLPGVVIAEEDDRIFSEFMQKHKGRFVVEFTEESELDDIQLKNLKDKYNLLGNQIAVDDYGAGYSNVNNLLRYMPDYVKIDRMLITEIHMNPQKKHMVRSIIDYAHNNNIVALAEGVETREELQECIRLGVDLIQGFYTGKATRVPVGEIDLEIRDEIEKLYNQNMTWVYSE